MYWTTLGHAPCCCHLASKLLSVWLAHFFSLLFLTITLVTCCLRCVWLFFFFFFSMCLLTISDARCASLSCLTTFRNLVSLCTFGERVSACDKLFCQSLAVARARNVQKPINACPRALRWSSMRGEGRRGASVGSQCLGSPCGHHFARAVFARRRLIRNLINVIASRPFG